MCKKGDNNRDGRHIISTLLWKDGGLRTLKSIADLVFASERIDVGPKRGKFSHPAWTNEKTGANEEGENERETHVVTVFPTWEIPHQLNNIITQPISAFLITHHPVIHKGHP